MNSFIRDLSVNYIQANDCNLCFKNLSKLIDLNDTYVVRKNDEYMFENYHNQKNLVIYDCVSQFSLEELVRILDYYQVCLSYGKYAEYENVYIISENSLGDLYSDINEACFKLLKKRIDRVLEYKKISPKDCFRTIEDNLVEKKQFISDLRKCF